MLRTEHCHYFNGRSTDVSSIIKVYSLLPFLWISPGTVICFFQGFPNPFLLLDLLIPKIILVYLHFVRNLHAWLAYS